MNWNMIGHEWAIDYLEQAMSTGHLGHALLVAGPPNVGKTTLALRLAQRLNCEMQHAPCGNCRACRRIANGNFPDVQIGGLEQQAAAQKASETIKSKLGIDAIRAWQADIHLRPYEGQRRVFILHDAHLMTEQAANALLKTLEEPPPFATLILVADGAGDLLPTITSRCHVLKLRAVPREQIEIALSERWNIAAADAALVAAWSGGRVGWAVQVAQAPDVLQTRLEQLETLIALPYQTVPERLRWVEQSTKGIKGAEREQLYDLLDIWQGWWRDVLLVAAGREEGLINVDRREQLEQLKQLPLQAIHSVLVQLDQAATQIRENVSPQLALEQVVLNLPTNKK